MRNQLLMNRTAAQPYDDFHRDILALIYLTNPTNLITTSQQQIISLRSLFKGPNSTFLLLADPGSMIAAKGH